VGLRQLATHWKSWPWCTKLFHQMNSLITWNQSYNIL
jgi:hypothetical protein